MDFSEVRDRVFTAYGEASYADGLATIRQARSHFPDRDSTLTFWEACFLSLLDQPEAALDALAAGLERGDFWHSRMLADPDLDAARTLPDWDDLVQESSARARAQAGERPDRLVRPAPDSVGTVLALHGAGEMPEDFEAEWIALIPPEWSVVAPVGDVPLADNRWAWPYDLATDSLSEAIADLKLLGPVIMLGFSQGSSMSAKAAWNGIVAANGLLLFAGPAPPTGLWRDSRQVPVPVYAVVGSADLAYRPCIALAAELEADGVPVHLDVREGLGHRPPDDLAGVIRSGIDWLLAQRAAIP